jgi:hypothetical protein
MTLLVRPGYDDGTGYVPGKLVLRKTIGAGILDTHPAAVAFSLRPLSYEQNAVRVRRDNDNEERDFLNTQAMDGSLESWVGVGNNGYVTIWYDQSGNGRHARQKTDFRQPLIVEDGVLYEHGLKFDGEDDNIDFPQPFGGVQGRSLFVVAITDLPENNRAILTLRRESIFDQTTNSVGELPGSVWSYTPEIAIRVLGGNQVWLDAPMTSLALTSLHLPDGGTIGDHDLYANGAQRTPTGATNPTVAINTGFSGLSSLGVSSNFNNRFRGGIRELVLYGEDKRADRVIIEANMNNFYEVHT